MGSHSSAEAPSANIAMARCSSESRSVHEMPSTACLHLTNPEQHDRTLKVKDLLKLSEGAKIRPILKVWGWVGSHDTLGDAAHRETQMQL
jgi:hypothetical protein